MFKKAIFSAALLLALAGCSSSPTTMQDVSSFCRSLPTAEYCNTQDSVCAKYSQIMLAPYKSAGECRKSCEEVRMKMSADMLQQDCLKVMMNVEEKCNEFCNSNYED